MKPALKGLLVAAAISLLALLAWRSQLSYSSTGFAGPSFHSPDMATRLSISSDLSHYLEAQGFKQESSPSGASWSGVHSADAKKALFVKKEGRDMTIEILVDLDETAVRTHMKWEKYGTRKSRVLAESQAYRFALRLDDWFRARSEINALPRDLAEQKRDGYHEKLVELKEER